MSDATEAKGWMANAIASDGALYRIREMAEVWTQGCNSYLVEAGQAILAECARVPATVDRLRVNAGLPTVAEATKPAERVQGEAGEVAE